MSGTWQKPALALEFDLVCEDFPGWSFPARLQLRDDLAPKQWRAEMNALATGSSPSIDAVLVRASDGRPAHGDCAARRHRCTDFGRRP